MKKLSIKLMLTGRDEYKPRVMVLDCNVVSNQIRNEHDLAGLLFAVEFAINNNASGIIGKSVRAHIELL